MLQRPSCWLVTQTSPMRAHRQDFPLQLLSLDWWVVVLPAEIYQVLLPQPFWLCRLQCVVTVSQRALLYLIAEKNGHWVMTVMRRAHTKAWSHQNFSPPWLSESRKLRRPRMMLFLCLIRSHFPMITAPMLKSHCNQRKWLLKPELFYIGSCVSNA